MKIVIKQNAHSVLRSYQKFGLNELYEFMIELTEGQTLEVETDHLFIDHFNTGPYNGPFNQNFASYRQNEYCQDLREQAKQRLQNGPGLKIQWYLVDKVIDDVRPDYSKCRVCFNTQLNEFETCQKCESTNLQKLY